eukprot:c43487_g1_i1 orf=335-817(+)
MACTASMAQNLVGKAAASALPAGVGASLMLSSSSANAGGTRLVRPVVCRETRRPLIITATIESGMWCLSPTCRHQTSKLIANAVAVKGQPGSSSATAKTGHELLLFEALREGLEEEMERDPRVCVVGEDVGHYGGSYKVTKGFTEKFGDLRVLDTPIAEN